MNLSFKVQSKHLGLNSFCNFLSREERTQFKFKKISVVII
jgi:hypothetical protein